MHRADKLGRLAFIVMLVASLGLAGCGRKAGLDAPPGAAIDPPSATASSDHDSPDAPAATPNSKKRSPLDWLID